MTGTHAKSVSAANEARMVNPLFKSVRYFIRQSPLLAGKAEVPSQIRQQFGDVNQHRRNLSHAAPRQVCRVRAKQLDRSAKKESADQIGNFSLRNPMRRLAKAPLDIGNGNLLGNPNWARA